MLFSRYDLKGIRVSLEVSLLSSLYLFRFCFILHFFYKTDTEKSYALRFISYDSDNVNYFKNFIFFFLLSDISESLST